MYKIRYSLRYAFTGLVLGVLAFSMLISSGYESSLSVIRFSIDHKYLGKFLDPFIVSAVLTLIFILLGARYGSKKGEKKDALTTQSGSQESLTSVEKVLLWGFSLAIFPVLPFTLLYYVYRNKYPQKVKEAYQIFWFTFVVWMIALVANAYFRGAPF